jgi:hypothetical protein
MAHIVPPRDLPGAQSGPSSSKKYTVPPRRKSAAPNANKTLGAQQRALPTRRYGVVRLWSFQPYSTDAGMDRAADNHIDVLKTPRRRVLSLTRHVASIASNYFRHFPIIENTGEFGATCPTSDHR